MPETLTEAAPAAIVIEICHDHSQSVAEPVGLSADCCDGPDLKNNALGLKSEGEHIGFGAQTLQKIIPEAVTKNSSGYLMVNSDPILWTMLNAIKEQQKEIAELKGQIRKLQVTSRRHRK